MEQPLSLRSFPHAILHIDADAFFASCEQAVNPALKGKPVVAGRERGIASAVSYEAKRRGVKRGMTIRGDVARIYLYMEASYPGRGILSDKNRPLFEAWNTEDPADAWECERDRRIAQLQGNPNPFVAATCGTR